MGSLGSSATLVRDLHGKEMSLGCEDEVLFGHKVVGVEQQVQILAHLTQKEAVHAIFELFGLDVCHCRVPALRSNATKTLLNQVKK
jgi:hypothetical protein